MRASLMMRAGSAAAAAVIATTGAMAATSAADASTHHARRLHTHLSIVKVKAIAHHKHLIAGRLTTHGHGLPGRVVFLDRFAGKHVVKVRRERTGKAGFAAFVVDPKGTAKFVIVFEGTPRLISSHSRVVTVKG
jgi:hypothetical protein